MIEAKKIISAGWLALLAVLLLQPVAADSDGVLAAHSLDKGSMLQWRLPERLQEISGLALSPTERLFAANDEQAVVFELDLQHGKLIKAFALGKPVLRGDFEGIAVVGSWFYLISSDGKLYRAKEGSDGEQVPYDVFDTGLGEHCEIEGLAAAEQQLLIACKQPTGDVEELSVFSWSIKTMTVDETATIALPLQPITAGLGKRRVNPSGIAVDPVTGNLILIAARQHALIELSAEGGFINARRLPMKRRHRQPEGIELMRDGRLLIADEGGNHKARLAVYERDIQRSVTQE